MRAARLPPWAHLIVTHDHPPSPPCSGMKSRFIRAVVSILLRNCDRLEGRFAHSRLPPGLDRSFEEIDKHQRGAERQGREREHHRYAERRRRLPGAFVEGENVALPQQDSEK